VTNEPRICPDATPQVNPGGVSLRAVAVSENGNGPIVDFEGLEAQSP